MCKNFILKLMEDFKNGKISTSNFEQKIWNSQEILMEIVELVNDKCEKELMPMIDDFAQLKSINVQNNRDTENFIIEVEVCHEGYGESENMYVEVLLDKNGNMSLCI